MKLQHLFISTIIIVFLSGCVSQRKKVTNYYLIEKPDGMEISIKEKQPTLNGFCEISVVQVIPAFSTQKIAVRSNTNEIKYYSYHFWAQRPDETFTLILEDYFSQSADFDGVSTRYWQAIPDYKLLMKVYKLEMIEDNEKVSAHLSLELKLIDTKENKQFLVQRADRYKLLAKKDLNLFAQAIGNLLYDELTNFSERIIQFTNIDDQDKTTE